MVEDLLKVGREVVGLIQMILTAEELEEIGHLGRTIKTDLDMIQKETSTSSEVLIIRTEKEVLEDKVGQVARDLETKELQEDQEASREEDQATRTTKEAKEKEPGLVEAPSIETVEQYQTSIQNTSTLQDRPEVL